MFKFQFHKGTIRTDASMEAMLARAYFNSIKVQLEPLIILKHAVVSKFQFHKGTIRTN